MSLFARRLALVLVACSGAAPAFAQSASCTATGQNQFVHDRLFEYYYWDKQLPATSPTQFDSPEAYLEAVRYRPLDEHFSFITGKAADQAFYSDSQFVGLGLSSSLVAAGELRVLQVFAGSPAAELGLERGDRILAIDGRSVAELEAAGLLGSAFGASEIGVTVEIRFRHTDGREAQGQATKRLVTIPTVSDTRVYDLGGRRVGYLLFRNFVRPSSEALVAAFAQFKAEGVQELVLDLRYNGGGLVSVAQVLGGLLGGTRTQGQVFARFVHNDRQVALNRDLYFEDSAQALELERVIVITTRSSASASELVINGLRPYLKVVVVGDATYGKPVGQYGFEFCEKVLYPVSFSLKNVRGEGDFFGGIPADCSAPDDYEHAFGDPAEASFAEALHVVRSGACSGKSAGSARLQSRPIERERKDGWQTLLNAH